MRYFQYFILSLMKQFLKRFFGPQRNVQKDIPNTVSICITAQIPQQEQKLCQKLRQWEQWDSVQQQEKCLQIGKKNMSGFLQQEYEERKIQRQLRGMVGEKYRPFRNNIWNTENQSQILYYKLRQKQQFLISYFISRKNYFLKYNLGKYISRHTKNNLTLIIPSNQCTFLQHKCQFVPDNNLILANIRSIQDGQYYTYHADEYKFNQRVEVLYVQNVNQLNFKPYDHIYIHIHKNYPKDKIQWFCSKITQNFTIQELGKVIYMLPIATQLSHITKLLWGRLQNQVMDQPIQNITSLLHYQIDIISYARLFPLIAVYRNRKKTNTSNYMNFAICLLMLQQSRQWNYLLHQKILKRIMKFTLSKYLKIKRLFDVVRNSPQYTAILINKKIITESEAIILKKSKIINLIPKQNCYTLIIQPFYKDTIKACMQHYGQKIQIEVDEQEKIFQLNQYDQSSINDEWELRYLMKEQVDETPLFPVKNRRKQKATDD